MRKLTRTASLVLAAAALAACADHPAAPAALDAGPRLSSATACAASPTFVVHTDPELRAALASAAWGDVIAISGNIPLDSMVTVTTEGVTFTCAEPGAGLSFAPGNDFGLLDLWVGHITISGLALDAEYGFSPVLVVAGFDPLSHVRLIGNDIECGYIFCIFADNHFEGDSTLFGVQIQLAPTGLVVSRNVIENEEAYLAPYGGIRVRAAHDAVVTHNQVRGWSNGIVLTDVYDSWVEHNRIEGSLRDGIDFALINASRITASGVSVKGNQISGSGDAGIAVRGACWNTFEGNNLQDNAVGARFEVNTGDNVYRGNHAVVQDGGAFDCDLDGDIDPNRFSGGQPQALPNALPGPSFTAAVARRMVRGGRSLPAAQ
jgi:parallel beta-helix repeat protein